MAAARPADRRRPTAAARGGAIADRAMDTWNAFSTPQKIITGLLVAGLVAGAVLVSRYVSQPSYSPLYSNLSGADASAMTDVLSSAGVPYELADGGTTIMVPAEEVYQQRLTMSAQGLPDSSDSGYALLDQQGVTTSQFQQQVAYQRAIEGELAATIGAIDGVEGAVVHLAIPQRDVFAQESDEPTASVLVDTSQGTTLDPDQVQAVVHLVSSSVEGMTAEAVTVVDGNGTLLSGPGAGDGSGSRSDTSAEFESALQADVQRLLDTVVGPGNAVAAVTADLDFDESQSVSERFVAEDGVPPLTESTTTEEYTSTGGAGVPGGILGPDNNGVTTGEGDATYTSETSDVTNAVGKITETTVTAPGAVQRLSVSVVVDTEASQAVDLDLLEQSVAAAVGVDEARGDLLSVTQLPFDATAAEAAQAELDAAAAAQSQARMWELIRTGVLAALVVAIIVITLIATRRRKPKVDVLDITTIEAADDAEEAADPMAALQAAIAETQLVQQRQEQMAREAAERQRAVSELVERQPDEVADLLRTWLADRRS